MFEKRSLRVSHVRPYPNLCTRKKAIFLLHLQIQRIKTGNPFKQPVSIILHAKPDKLQKQIYITLRNIDMKAE